MIAGLARRRWRASGAPHLAVLVALAVCACGGAADDNPAAPSKMLPSLVEVPLPPEHQFVTNELASVVVGDFGEVLLVEPESRGGTLILIAGDTVRRYGSPGEGPGEMRMAQPMLADDSLVVAFDLATRRVMVFDRASGHIRREFRPDQPVIPVLRGSGRTLIASRFEAGVESPSVLDLSSGRVRPAISAADSYRVELFSGDDEMPGGSINTAVLGRWSGGVLLANGMTYRIGLYDRDGRLAHRIERNLAPRQLTESEIELEMSRLEGTPMARSRQRLDRIRDQLGSTPIRWFTHRSPPRDDGKGRLWVMLQHGDSTTADLYSAGEPIGQLRLDCPGFGGQWDLSGDWLVLLCFPVDPESLADAEVRRWRIVG